MSRSKYARIERGELRRVRIGDLEATCAPLGADLDIRIRWHGEGLDRLLDAAHARLVDLVVRRLRQAGWECRVEVSFNVWGERGSVDVVGWQPGARAVLVVEVKSVIPDAQATIAVHDRKVRLAPEIAKSRGWQAAVVGGLLVVADGSTARQRLAALPEVFDAAYPDRAVAVRRWIAHPSGRLSGLLVVRIDHGVARIRVVAGRQRVRLPRTAIRGGQ